jgi:diguanylate cyclase (GGDEF)-like protein/PAS domain S-box-containing protein
MMHSIDRNGHLLEVSDLWLETLGYERHEVIGTNLVSYLSMDSRRLAEETVLPLFFQQGYVKDVPYQMIKKNGEPIDVLISAIAERDRRGRFLRSMAGIVDVTLHKRKDEEIQRLAHYDPLTGQPNRLLFRDRLRQALARAYREERNVGVVFVDLDRFKWVNDTHGHAVGDKLLQVVAQRLTDCIRHCDTVARIGGDEFVIILCGFESDGEPTIFAKRFLEVISHPVKLDGKEFFGTASVGIAIYPIDGQDDETLLRNADIAMYAAKEKGGNNFQFFSADMNARAKEKLHLETRLRRALENGQLSLAYQPQLSLRGGQIAGLEALLRWHDPEEGMIPPARFIPVAEETGLIIPLGEWVLKTACTQAQAWQEAGYAPIRMAVNVSGLQFKRLDFVDMVESTLRETGFDPNLLEIELTESIIMENVKDAIMTLADLKVRGIHLAIDDFGTGYSSLVYLKNFPFDRIKIAQEFVRTISMNHDHEAIVEAIIYMASSLDLNVIAEGVETKAQLDFLRARKCQSMQGYYFSPPVAAESWTPSYERFLARKGGRMVREQLQ